MRGTGKLKLLLNDFIAYRAVRIDPEHGHPARRVIRQQHEPGRRVGRNVHGAPSQRDWLAQQGKRAIGGDGQRAQEMPGARLAQPPVAAGDIDKRQAVVSPCVLHAARQREGRARREHRRIDVKGELGKVRPDGRINRNCVHNDSTAFIPPSSCHRIESVSSQ